MSTSLREQLKRLAVPQTISLIDARRKASILFEPKEAATKNRRTIYELGVSGLQELIALNPNFQQFEATLFEEATLNLERSVEHSDVNRLLDLNITKFLHHLSPYFLLRPAHMCLEWLLRRFYIHQYNVNAVLALALPYHETNIFVRVLQTLSLRSADKDWLWLRPLQKPGLPLTKSVVVKRAASDTAFLTFVCRSTQDVVRELGPYAHRLQAQLNFYASVVVGALKGTSFVSEKYVVAILPSMLQGFNSTVVDYVSAVYIIASQLVSRIQVTNKLCNSLVKHVAAISIEKLRPAAVLLLICIFDTQQIGNPQFSQELLLNFVSQKWPIDILASLAKENVDIYPLCAPLLRGAVSAIHNSEEAGIFKQFLDSLLDDVKFPNSTAQKFINCLLDSFVDSRPSNDTSTKCDQSDDKTDDDSVIELDSDEEMADAHNSFQSWYSDYLRKLEHQYPDAYDQTIKTALKSNQEENNNRSKALKIAIGFRLKCFGQDTTDVYESLYHYTATIRLCAIQTLLTNLHDYKARPQNYQLLRECLADRIRDDSELIVKEVLKLCTKDFLDILGHNKFVEALLHILHKTLIDAGNWAPLTRSVLKHLTGHEVVEQYDCNLILLALMPLLFPSESTCTASDYIVEILRSPLAMKVPFLQKLQLNAGANGTDFSTTEFKKQFLGVVSSCDNTPTLLELLKSVQSQGQDFFKSGMQFSHFLLLITAGCKQSFNSTECLEIFKQISLFVKPFQVKHLEKKQWKQIQKQNFIPLQLFSDFVTTLTQHTHFDNLLQWEPMEKSNSDLQCFLCIFALLTKEAFTQEQPTEKLEWSKLLKDIFDTVFENAQAKLEFLCNFYVYEQINCVNNYTVLRIRAFKLMNAVLKNTNNKLKLSMPHILKITIALMSPSEVLRLEALASLEVTVTRLREHLKIFVEDILERSNEISMDNEQYALVLYTILKPTKRKPKELEDAKILSEILKQLTAREALQHANFSAGILKTLKHVNDEEILSELLPLADCALNKSIMDGAMKLIPIPYSCIYQLIMERFDGQTVENMLLDNEEAWQLFVKTFNNHDVLINSGNKMQPLPCFILKTLGGPTYLRVPQKYRTELIKLVLKTVAIAENDTIFLVANKLLKKYTIDCAPLVTVLEGMFPKVGEPKLNKRKSAVKCKSTNSPCEVNTAAWKQGSAVLELLEGKRKLKNADKLIPALFELLKYCLQVEEQAAVEYVKQLTLSVLLNTCQKAQADEIDLPNVLPKSTFRIDQIVQCLRSTQNPQTHHNALLLLSHCATLFPQQVLHNIVDIFTFMGSSVVRHDDAFSFHIINRIIESVVPILVRGKADDESPVSAESVNSHVIPVLKVFSDIMLDVPEHRRLPLYTKLLQTLGADRFLWYFLCVVFEQHVIDDEKQRLLQKKQTTSAQNAVTNNKLPKRVEAVLELSNSFEPQIVLETCIQLLHYISTLPVFKADEQAASTRNTKKHIAAADATEVCLFDVKCRTAKQLRHYKYVIMQFLSTITSSPLFLRKVALLSDKQLLSMKPFHQNFIIKTLSYVPVVNAAIENCEEPSQTKFWKVILHHVHDVLDNAISLLSPNMFLLVVGGLMQHQVLSIRKKVIDLLICKLQQRDSYFEACDDKNFHNLLQPLTNIVDTILRKSDASSGIASPLSSSPNELIFIQQNALIAIKLLSKMFALKYIEDFKGLLGNLTNITKKRNSISKILLATIILTMIEISSNLKAHALAYLPKYMPQLIEVLQEQKELVRQQPPDHVCVALIAGMQKLVESLPLFLGPYIVDIITSFSTIASCIKAQNNEKDQRSAIALNKVTAVWTKMANEVPVRILVPGCEKAYKQLMAAKCYADISMLMKLVHESVSSANNSDLGNVQIELTNFFLEALSLRQQLKGSNLDNERLSRIEDSIIDALVAWVLKLSESSFRPLYHRVYEWAFKQSAQKEAMLTYFLLTNKIAEALKSLFVLFASNFIEDAAKLLNECNCTKNTIDPDDELLHVDLLRAILSTLYNVFLHDSKKFVTTQRFEVLMQPIVDQLENRLTLENESLLQILTSCIAQFALSVSSDILCKQLNYQVLLKTRTSVPEVRIHSFNSCVEIARKLGEDFTPLLPETVPFIAELFEDENPRVEKNTRKSVQELEGILGESLQKYL